MRPATCSWFPREYQPAQSMCRSALRGVRIVAVGVALSDCAVLLVNQVLDAVLLRRCATGRLRLGLSVVSTRSASSTLAAVGPPILGRHRVNVLLVGHHSSPSGASGKGAKAALVSVRANPWTDPRPAVCVAHTESCFPLSGCKEALKTKINVAQRLLADLGQSSLRVAVAVAVTLPFVMLLCSAVTDSWGRSISGWVGIRLEIMPRGRATTMPSSRPIWSWIGPGSGSG